MCIHAEVWLHLGSISHTDIRAGSHFTGITYSACAYKLTETRRKNVRKKNLSICADLVNSDRDLKMIFLPKNASYVDEG